MSKKLWVPFLLLLLTATPSAAQTPATLTFAFPQLSLNASGGGAGTNGTAYALVGNPASVLTWQVSLSSAPASSITVVLQCSPDNSTWNTCDTSTNVNGEARVITLSSQYIRSSISAQSGGGNVTVTFTARGVPNASYNFFTGGVITGPVTFNSTTTFGSQALFLNGTASAPPINIGLNNNNGLYSFGSGYLNVAVAGQQEARFVIGTGVESKDCFSIGTSLDSGTDTFWCRDAANVSSFKNGSNIQSFRLYNTTTGSNFVTFTSANEVTPAASQAAGGTVNDFGTMPIYRYQVTVTPASGDCSTAFKAAALTADCTIATLPAGMKLEAIYADVTAGFTCSGTCTGTKVMQAGTTAGGTQILAASLNVATTATYGLADADLGSGMVRASAIQGGLIGSWSTTTPVSVRFTSGTGNWGTGTVTNVNAGTVKFTLITQQIK